MTTRAAAPLTDAIAAHHAEMETELRQRVDDLITVVALGEPHAEATGRVVDYALSTLLPHAASEEVSLYAAAAPFEARLVRSLIGEHDALRRLVSQLAAGGEAAAGAAAAAGAVAELFALHAAKENEYIVPALLEHVPAQIPALMRRMHEESQRGSHPRVVATLDVRHIPHAARHGQVFARLEALVAGDALRVVNDHDPVPLRQQLDAISPGVFSWSYEETGPELWRVLIARREGAEHLPVAADTLVAASGHDALAGAMDRDGGESAIVRGLARLLGRSLRSLGEAGRPGDAGRMAGEAWALLRESAPDEAARLSGVMHGLARGAGGDPQGAAAETDGTAPELDVRSDPPAVRHRRIFDTFASLAPGEAFVLVNDHDPVPLRYQFAAEHAGEVEWEPLEEGPAIWRVRIGRIAPA